MSLVKLENVTKHYYRGQNVFTALKDINFQIQPNEFTAIVGASGSGKSTLMNIIGLLDRASVGNYLFNGQDVSTLSDLSLAAVRNKQIGFVFQSFFLLPRLTALQNVMLPLLYRHESIIHQKEQAKQLALDLLKQMHVAHLANHKPNQLSGGQQQRVAIARALINDPNMILADEPTGALDSGTSEDVMQLFKKLHREQGRTIVIITHDVSISRQCERIVTMKDGTIHV